MKLELEHVSQYKIDTVLGLFTIERNIDNAWVLFLTQNRLKSKVDETGSLSNGAFEFISPEDALEVVNKMLEVGEVKKEELVFMKKEEVLNISPALFLEKLMDEGKINLQLSCDSIITLLKPLYKCENHSEESKAIRTSFERTWFMNQLKSPDPVRVRVAEIMLSK